MKKFAEYQNEIKLRKTEHLKAKPISDGDLIDEIVAIVDDNTSEHYADAVSYLIYNVLPGTTKAAERKSAFLKSIILGERSVDEISPNFAFELLSHMKGGSSIEVLLDLVLCEDIVISTRAVEILHKFSCMIKTSKD